MHAKKLFLPHNNVCFGECQCISLQAHIVPQGQRLLITLTHTPLARRCYNDSRKTMGCQNFLLSPKGVTAVFDFSLIGDLPGSRQLIFNSIG